MATKGEFIFTKSRNWIFNLRFSLSFSEQKSSDMNCFENHAYLKKKQQKTTEHKQYFVFDTIPVT